jgi:hypothetical protein
MAYLWRSVSKPAIAFSAGLGIGIGNLKAHRLAL